MSLFDAAWDAFGDRLRWRINEAVKHDVYRQVEMEPVSDETSFALIFRVSDECAGLNIEPVIDGLIRVVS